MCLAGVRSPLPTEGHSVQAAVQDTMPAPLTSAWPGEGGAWWAAGVGAQHCGRPRPALYYESWPDSSELLYL